jgi:hypothetical protein
MNNLSSYNKTIRVKRGEYKEITLINSLIILPKSNN